MNIINRFRKYYCLALQSFISISLFALVCVNLYQVITRYAVDVTVLWTEDFSILTMLWMAACGFGWLWATHRMLSMDVANYIFPRKVLHLFDYILELAGLFIGPGLVYIGSTAYRANSGLVTTMTGFDEKLRYLPLIFAGILILLSSVLRLLELIAADCSAKKELRQEKGGNA